MNEDEHKKGYVLKELERCEHCGQKLVISEVKQTRYRSCPSINVKLGDKAKEDTIIPVKFGINKGDIISRYWIMPFLILMSIYGTLLILGIDLLKFIPIFPLKIPILSNPNSAPFISIFLRGLILIGLWIFVIPTFLYKSIKLFKWYNSVKHTLRRMNYE